MAVAEPQIAYVARLLQNEPELKELNLSNQGISAFDSCHLAGAVKSNRWLRKLNLTGNQLGDEGSLFVADMLLGNSSLTYLNISRNGITDKGAAVIIQALEKNGKLATLEWEGNDISEDTTKQLKYWLELNVHPPDLKKFLPAIQADDTETRVLDLSGDDTDAKVYNMRAVQMVADAVAKNTNLRRLVLDRNFKGDEKIEVLTKALKENTTVTSLSFASDHVGPEGALHLVDMLRDNTRIIELDLTDNELHDLGARRMLDLLSVNHTLRRLGIRDNDIEPTLMKKLEASLTLNAQPTMLKTLLPQVTTDDSRLCFLDLHGEPSDPSGPKVVEDIKGFYTNLSATILADALKRNTHVRDVDLSNNYVGPEGAQALASLLHVNQFITRLDLNNNYVQDEGARPLVDALAINGSVIELNLEGNGLSNKMRQAVDRAVLLNRVPAKLKEALPLLQSNDASMVSVSFSELDQLAPSPYKLKINRLDDTCCEMLAAALKFNDVLTNLDLSRQHISDLGVEALARLLKQNGRITKLNLNHNNSITDDGINMLIHLLKMNDSIISMEIDGCQRVTPICRVSLENAVKMNHEPAYLKQVIPHLVNDDPGLKHLSFKPVLQLRQAGGYQDRRAIEDIASSKPAKGDFRDSSCVLLLEALTNNNFVTTLILAQNAITDKGMLIISEFLVTNKTIVTLDVSHNLIGTDGALAFHVAMKDNCTLRDFSISGNCISPSGGRYLRNMLKKNYSLKTLLCEDCSIGQKIYDEVQTAVSLNSQPAEVKSKLHEAWDEAVELDTLDFSDINSTSNFGVRPEDQINTVVTDDTVQMLVACIRENPFVSAVDLSNGEVTSKGCKILANMLVKNTCMLTLKLRCNKINDEGVGHLLEALGPNNTLIEVDLEGNPDVSDHALLQLQMATSLNSQPQQVKGLAFRMMKGDGSMKSIHLGQLISERSIDDGTCEALEFYITTTNYPVRDIDLSNGMITDSGMTSLAKLLKATSTLKTLKLDNNQISSDGFRIFLSGLAENKSLTKLSITGNDEASPVTLQSIENKLRFNQTVVPDAPIANVPRKSKSAGRLVLEQPIQPSFDELKAADDAILRDALGGIATLSHYAATR